LLKARGRGERSLVSVADELNMSFGTLRKWIQSSGQVDKPSQVTHLALEGPAASWSAAQRMGALHESYSLSGEALAGWCREHGLFEHQLRQWHDDFCAAGVSAVREAPGAFRELQRQHDLLQRELRRKEKALAEVAALLVLQKNFQALLEGADK
jgi:transposase